LAATELQGLCASCSNREVEKRQAPAMSDLRLASEAAEWFCQYQTSVPRVLEVEVLKVAARRAETRS
jgi:hypothetical protein